MKQRMFICKLDNFTTVLNIGEPVCCTRSLTAKTIWIFQPSVTRCGPFSISHPSFPPPLSVRFDALTRCGTVGLRPPTSCFDE